jgi:hypothetical protein
MPLTTQQTRTMYWLPQYRQHKVSAALPRAHQTRCPPGQCSDVLAWLWVDLASRILRPSHRHRLWPGCGLAWPERCLCDKSCILQGSSLELPPILGGFHIVKVVLGEHPGPHTVAVLVFTLISGDGLPN